MIPTLSNWEPMVSEKKNSCYICTYRLTIGCKINVEHSFRKKINPLYFTYFLNSNEIWFSEDFSQCLIFACIEKISQKCKCIKIWMGCKILSHCTALCRIVN